MILIQKNFIFKFFSFLHLPTESIQPAYINTTLKKYYTQKLSPYYIITSPKFQVHTNKFRPNNKRTGRKSENSLRYAPKRNEVALFDPHNAYNIFIQPAARKQHDPPIYMFKFYFLSARFVPRPLVLFPKKAYRELSPGSILNVMKIGFRRCGDKTGPAHKFLSE